MTDRTRSESTHIRAGRRIFTSALFAFVFFVASFVITTSPATAASNPRYASIVMDADTGMILSQENADKSLHPASLAKMMTLLLTFEAIENGKLRLRDRVVMSSHAASMPPSKLALPIGSTIRVEDAIYALVTKSANDVAVALGEKVAGTESRFAVEMNRKAREIGMTRTYFRNASGLHNKAQVSSARDMARLARYILMEYPRYYHYFSTQQFTYQGATYYNHNRLMRSYRGMDGFKTGYISPSGFNLVASAVRNNRRIIGVVFGGRTAASRNAQMAKILDRGFEKMESVAVAKNVPLPPRKPDRAILLADLSPASGGDTSVKWADLNPILESKAFSALIGQGDYDPAVSKRLETGLLAIAALKGVNIEDKTETATATNTAAAPITENGRPWAIQIGAFSSRIKTDRALQKALDGLPGDLSNAAAVIVPLKTNEGWLFRGRLSGFTQQDAARACRYLKDCMPISPYATY